MGNGSKLLVELRYDDQLLHLTLNAPKANILDSGMMTEIEKALDEHGKRSTLKAIVFEGAGSHFCFGASVPEHTAEKAAGMLEAFHGLFLHLSELNIPTIAIVRGQCLGGGMELASYCSWIFAEPSAWFGQPEIQLAVFAPVASILLPWRIGGGRAMDFCVSGRALSAQESLELGLVSAISEDARAYADGFFEKNLAPRSGSSLRFAEKAVRTGLNQALIEGLPAMERLYVDELMATHDANEGIGAFLEKRAPVFEK